MNDNTPTDTPTRSTLRAPVESLVGRRPDPIARLTGQRLVFADRSGATLSGKLVSITGGFARLGGATIEAGGRTRNVDWVLLRLDAVSYAHPAPAGDDGGKGFF